MEKEIHYLNYYFDNSKLMIDKKKQLFLNHLIKSISIKAITFKQNRIINNLKTWIEKINKNLIINKGDHISSEYTTFNLKNILKICQSPK